MATYRKRGFKYRLPAGGIALGALLLALGLALLAPPAADDAPTPEAVPPWTAAVTEPRLTLYRHEQDDLMTLALEEYVLGVVMAEMPLLFGAEALKAQAVCARTYALRSMATPTAYERGADVSDDILSCQAYVSYDDYRGRHPAVEDELLAAATRAVAATRGEVLLYAGTPADTVYHASCGGQTADAQDVWGGAAEYLRSVRCEADSCRDYSRSFRYTAAELSAQLGMAATNSVRVKVTARDDSGRALRVRVNDKDFSGAEFRQRLALPSTALTIIEDGSHIELQTQGYGHGVGLCQHGAAALGQSGSGYREILEHYYPGAELVSIAW